MYYCNYGCFLFIDRELSLASFLKCKTEKKRKQSLEIDQQLVGKK